MTDDDRWAALASRDPAADAAFVYSVRTTGVYCRPSCPARRPNRANVRFHDTAVAAERAGFRACKRCGPAAGHGAAVAEACRRLAADEPPDLAALADAAGLSRFHFHRVFKSVVGVTPKAYAAAERGRRAREQLAAGASVTAAAAGFGSASRFYAAAPAALGMAPAAYRAGGRGEVIRFAVGDSSLGRVLVAATAVGVCAVFLGDDADELTAELRRRFPKADVQPADAAFGATVANVVALVEAPAAAFDLPLDLRGTAFQVRVWEALRRIPAGTTTTYAKLAEQLGQPTAARAVARACATNHVSVAVPCHRVVGATGALTGYRWGVARKAELLKREAAGGR
ncbi:bifunctional DNA-binding transcriptional regulator/O6-methylguanine-DNA methyltransferase Ada [Urbifossiella limnaea]|uniref:methylated-DNA--[protein]-cysteine S-methyltransferase n=1 Tax=Urbifossiella limnaea TaxID=2528023 RepID=A0A517Y1P1_9BACT|nr:bifunctional DNA-binding transcriptional regulator/O6-methylguanine-DNA methyltransferase Ada [Urbifossiella limnaea]QDU23654.1 Bifunctional transcriptional activator/DNA repair enzyme Ada [Urbifossiella limnaea]